MVVSNAHLSLRINSHLESSAPRYPEKEADDRFRGFHFSDPGAKRRPRLRGQAYLIASKTRELPIKWLDRDFSRVSRERDK